MTTRRAGSPRLPRWPRAKARAATRRWVPGAGRGSVSANDSPGRRLEATRARDLQEVAFALGHEELDVEDGQARPIGAGPRGGEGDLDLVAALGHAQAGDGRRGRPQRRQGVALLAAGGQEGEQEERGPRPPHRMNRVRSRSCRRGASRRAHDIGLDGHARLAVLARGEAHLFEDGLEDGGEAARADVLGRWLTCMAKRAISRMASSVKTRSTPSVARRARYWAIRAFLGSVRMRTRSASVSGRQLDPDGKAPLQLRDEVAGLAHVEGAGGDEQDVVGAHRAVLGGYGGALHDGQQVALDPLAGDVGPRAPLAPRDLVDLVDEHDGPRTAPARWPRARPGAIHEARLLLLEQHLAGLGTGGLAPGLAAAEEAGEHVADLATSISSTPWAPRIWKAGRLDPGHLDLDGAVVEGARAELLAQLLAGGRGATGGRASRGGRGPGRRPGLRAGSRRSRRRSSVALGGSARTSASLLAADHVDGAPPPGRAPSTPRRGRRTPLR